MEFNQKQLKVKKITPVRDKKPARFRGVAAAVFSAFMLASPLVSGKSYAEERMKPAEGPRAGVAIDLGTGEHEGTEEHKKKKEGLDKKKSEAKKKGAPATPEPFDVDNSIAAGGAAEAGEDSISTISAAAALAAMDEILRRDVSAPEPQEPKEEAVQGEEEMVGPLPVQERRGRRLSHNLLSVYDTEGRRGNIETNLAPIPGMVGARGGKTLDGLGQPVDLGVNAMGNEAGHSIFGTFRYLNLMRLDAGATMFVGMPMVPVGRLMLSPEFNVRYNKGEIGEGAVKGAYYGSAALAANLPSWVYSSHSVGLGWAQSAGDDFKLRIAGIIGGAISYPAWDDIYVNLSTGLSMEFAKTILIYGVPDFYFAADNPMRTAYIGYYRPKIQSIEAGVQAMIRDGFVLRGFADVGLLGENYGIFNKYGIKLTKMVTTKSVEMDLWGTIGMTHWSPLFGGGVDPLIMVGITGSYSGDGYRSTNSYSFSHERMLDVSPAKASIPDSKNLGPYGFGNSGDPSFDVPINEAKQRILDAGSFSQFSGTYSGASQEEVITTARFLGAFMAQVAYANDAFDSMTTGNIFDSEIKRIASTNHEEMFNYIRNYISWYQSRGAGEPLPESLMGGIAVCAGIHSLVTAYLVDNGVEAVTVSVNTPNGPHMVTVIPRHEGKNLLIDYGNMFETSGDILHLFDEYGRHRGAPTFKSQVYGPNGEYMGTINTSSERLLRESMGIDNKKILLREYLGIW